MIIIDLQTGRWTDGDAGDPIGFVESDFLTKAELRTVTKLSKHANYPEGTREVFYPMDADDSYENLSITYNTTGRNATLIDDTNGTTGDLYVRGAPKVKKTG